MGRVTALSGISVSTVFPISQGRLRKALPSQGQHGSLLAFLFTLYQFSKNFPLPLSKSTWAGSSGPPRRRADPCDNLLVPDFLWVPEALHDIYIGICSTDLTLFLFSSHLSVQVQRCVLGLGLRATFWPQSWTMLSILVSTKTCPKWCKFLVAVLIKVDSLFPLTDIKISKHEFFY